MPRADETEATRFVKERYPEHREVGVWLRRGHRLSAWGVPVLPRLIQIFIRVAYGADIPISLDLDRDVVFMHNGLGTVVNGKTRFDGPATIFQHVTFGHSLGENEGTPRVGAYVVVGAGACVLGGITLGAYSLVGAGVVLTQDLPPYHRAIGSPPRISAMKPDQVFHIWRHEMPEPGGPS